MPAVIDVGTHTVRLLIAELIDGELHTLHYDHVITHLGEGASPVHGLAAQAMARTLTAIESFADKLHHHKPKSVRVIGTQALRSAVNRYSFAQQLHQRTGLVLDVVDGQDEALLTASGVLSVVKPIPQRCLIFDVGGGSTEFVWVENGCVRFSRSWPVGVVSLLASPKPSAVIASMITELKQQLSCCVLFPQRGNKDWALVGTAGTVTTLAALQLEMGRYQPDRIDNLRLNVGHLNDLQQRLSQLTVAEREMLPGIEVGRGATIIPGLELVLQVVNAFACRELVVCDAGLLQGVFHSSWGNGQLLLPCN